MTTNQFRLRRLPLLLLLLCACCLCISCMAPRGEVPKVSAQERLTNFVAALGDVAVQIKGTEYVKAHAPHLMPILDVNQDGTLSVPELMSLDFEEPATLALLFFALEDLIRGKKGG